MGAEPRAKVASDYGGIFYAIIGTGSCDKGSDAMQRLMREAKSGVDEAILRGLGPWSGETALWGRVHGNDGRRPPRR